MTAIAFALKAFEILPTLIAAGKDIAGFITQTQDALKRMQAENRDPSQAEWDALNAQIAELRAALHA